MIKRFAKKLISVLGYAIVEKGVIPMDVRQLRTFSYWYRMYPKIHPVEGAIVECGVGRGRTFLYLSYLNMLEGKNREQWGFDSFAGFPSPDQRDAGGRNPKRGEWSGVAPQDIKEVLLSAGVRSEFVDAVIHLVPGFFPESFKAYSGSKVALLHLDVDLYRSYKDCLDFFYPKVAPNGVILFDEYNEERWPGATQAINEFFKNKSEEIEKDEEIDKYFVVKR